MPFLVYDMVSVDLLNVWLILGQLVVMLWQTAIDELDAYLVCVLGMRTLHLLIHLSKDSLQKLIADFLLATAICSPSIIVSKPKFHFLLHIPTFIRRFGPAILFSTERFESFNAVFRASSIFSNGHAASCDIANSFMDLDRLKHICSGELLLMHDLQTLLMMCWTKEAFGAQVCTGNQPHLLCSNSCLRIQSSGSSLAQHRNQLLNLVRRLLHYQLLTIV
jgi:hypothetical protein